MTAPNHIVGGYVFTGFFASIAGVNFLSDPYYLPVIFFAALLPDIDHPKSILGRVFYPISILIHRKFGHRTLTHSLVFLIFSTTFVKLLQSIFFPDFHITLVFFLAVLSHFLFDIITVQGIPLFYPFYNNAFVLPGDPLRRITTNNIRHESIAFSIFVVSSVFLQPLFHNGFWNQYNRTFGTLHHLQSEYHKSRTLLGAKFIIMEGSELDTIEGSVVHSHKNSFTILRNGSFESYPQKGQFIKKIIPTRTSYYFKFVRDTFYNLSPDSLCSLVQMKKITKLKFSSNHKLLIDCNKVKKESYSFLGADLNDLSLVPILSGSSSSKKNSIFLHNPQIDDYKNQLVKIQNKYDDDVQKYQLELGAYNSKYLEMINETNYAQREILQIKFTQLKKPTPPKPIDQKLINIQSKLTNLIHNENLNYKLYSASHSDISNSTIKINGDYEEVLIIDSLNFKL